MRASLSGKIRRAVRNRIRLPGRSPFVAGTLKPVIVHASHHKAGTTWFQNILVGVGQRYGLNVQILRKSEVPERNADIVLNQGSRGVVEGIAHLRGSHMVRDPRDIAVSAFHYHLWTKEKWVHEPHEAYGGLSYQEYLKSLDPHDGLSAEIRRLGGTVFRLMSEWDYHRSEYLELRYEDVIVDEATWFDRLFRHYGFNDPAVAEALEIAERNSFGSATKRGLGEVTEGSHMRSGRPEQWREEFTDDHIALFKQRTGDLLIRLGYESDDRW